MGEGPQGKVLCALARTQCCPLVTTKTQSEMKSFSVPEVGGR